MVRTTLTLDADVAKALEQEQRRTHASFKEVVNRALRVGLSLAPRDDVPLRPFVVHAKRCGFRQGVDASRLNQLVDELEADAFSDTHST